MSITLPLATLPTYLMYIHDTYICATTQVTYTSQVHVCKMQYGRPFALESIRRPLISRGWHQLPWLCCPKSALNWHLNFKSILSALLYKHNPECWNLRHAKFITVYNSASQHSPPPPLQFPHFQHSRHSKTRHSLSSSTSDEQRRNIHQGSIYGWRYCISLARILYPYPSYYWTLRDSSVVPFLRSNWRLL